MAESVSSERLFPTLTPEQVQRAAAHGRIRAVHRGEVLVESGSANMRFFIVKTGTDLSPDDLAAAHWLLPRRPYLLETSLPGVFAVGDVRAGNLKRVASAPLEKARSRFHSCIRCCTDKQGVRMSMENDNNRWRQSAPYWEKHRDIIRIMFSPVTEALIAETKIARGSNVLDVGTGPGEPALSIAGRVGNEGKVTGIDPAPEMIEAACRAAGRAGLDNVHFEVSPADRLPFEENRFDAVVSRFVAMFLPDPLQSVREIVRVLKAGGLAAFAVWSFADNNPFFYVFERVVERYVAPSPPGAPDPFRYATPGQLRAILEQAGMTGTSDRLLQFKIEAPVSVEDFWSVRSQMSDRLRSKIGALPAEQTEDIRRHVIDGLRVYDTGSGTVFPAEVRIIGGRKNA